MTSIPRGCAAGLAAALLAVAWPAPARAQEAPAARPEGAQSQEEQAGEDARAEPGDFPPPLPSLSIDGWRVGGSLYGGWDSNAVDLPEGPSSKEVDLGVDAAVGRQGRFSMVEAVAEGSRRQYADVDGRNSWLGGIRTTAGRRLSKNSVGSLGAGYRYDYTDGFLALPDVSTQLPRTTARGLVGEARYAVKPARRLTWSNLARYETLDFGDDTLVDTDTLRLRGELRRQVSRVDQVGPRYEFLRAKWAPDSSDIQSFLAGWAHGGEREGWSLDAEAGASRGVAPAVSGRAIVWRFAGTAYAAYKSGRTALDVTLRRGMTPGYGQSRLLENTTFQFSALYFFTRDVNVRVGGAAERTTDRFDPVYGTAKGGYLDTQVEVRVTPWLDVAGSYRYRIRDSFGTRVQSNRFGVSLGTAIQSTRRRETRGPR